MAFHYWLVLHPDITRPIGGVKQMHRLAEAIILHGRQATIIQDIDSFHPGWFASKVDTISFVNWQTLRDSGKLSDGNILVFPETYISSIEDYSRGIPSIIFNQNASYTYGMPSSKQILNPKNVLRLYNLPFVKHILCVSKYDYHFLSSYLAGDPRRVSLIINGLEDDVFSVFSAKKKRIVYMPRKNTLDSLIVSNLVDHCPALKDWKMIPLSSISHRKVITHLHQSLIFLSFGHPEGFGLPVAEALASGCAVAGYSGLGGKELFEIGSRHNVAIEIEYGDWSGFVSALLAFDQALISSPRLFLDRLLSSSNQIKSTYNMQCMNSSVGAALSRIESSL